MTMEQHDKTDWAALKVTNFVCYDEASSREDLGLGGMGGWFGESERGWDAGHRWKDYVESYNEEVRPALEELRKALIKHGIRCTGEQQQNRAEVCPLWSNGKADTYSFRAWGDLMAAIWSTEDNKDYSYMDFYM
jgi:hypothetical protein